MQVLDESQNVMKVHLKRKTHEDEISQESLEMCSMMWKACMVYQSSPKQMLAVVQIQHYLLKLDFKVQIKGMNRYHVPCIIMF